MDKLVKLTSNAVWLKEKYKASDVYRNELKETLV